MSDMDKCDCMLRFGGAWDTASGMSMFHNNLSKSKKYHNLDCLVIKKARINDKDWDELSISQSLLILTHDTIPRTCNTVWERIIYCKGDVVIHRDTNGRHETNCKYEKCFYAGDLNLERMVDVIKSYLIAKHGSEANWRYFAVKVIVSNLSNDDEPPDRIIRIIYGLEVSNV